MKLRILLIAAVLAACVQGVIFAKGIAEERNAYEYNALAEQVDAYIDADEYASAIPLLKRMHELKPRELMPVEYLGISYLSLPEERPEFINALFWLTEAEKRGSSNADFIYYNLACIYSLKGDVEKAEATMNKALALGFSNLDWISQDDDLVNFRTGSWWEGIADNYTQIEELLGLFDEFASNEVEESITDRIEFYDYIVTALKELAPHIPALQSRPLSFLASSYEDMGDYAKAERYYLEATAIREKALGKEHPYYATSLNNLGLLYYSMGDYAKAERYYLEATVIWEKALGKEHPSYATSLNNLGGLYDGMGDYAKAERYYLEATAIREKALGKEHPDYATSLNNLGALYWNMGDYAKAERYFLEATAIREKALGKEHPDYATSLNNLGLLYDSMGDYAKAERYYLEATAIFEKTLGKEHPSYATSLIGLGLLYKSMGDYAKAERYYLEATAIFEKALGKEHPDYATSLNNLGALYDDMGDYAKAERYYLEATAIREKALGKEHPDYATSLIGLGGLYYSMGDYAKAERYYLEATAIFEKALGKEHPSYATSLDNLYGLYLSKKEYTKALVYKQEQIKIKTAIVNKNFSFQTEQQRDAYWNANSGSFEFTYSLSFFHPVPESNALNYENTLFSKGLLLRTTNAVRDAIYSSGNQALIAQFEELGSLRQQISTLKQNGGNETNIKTLEEKAEALDKSLTQSSVAFKDLKEDLAINWQNVRDNLQPNEAAIEFVSFKIFDKKWTDTVQYAALVLRPGMNAPEWVPLCSEEDLQEILSRAEGRSSEVKARILYSANGLRLFNLIWEPLEKELNGVTTIYYSPSKLFHKIAFNALPVDDSYEVRLTDKYNLNLVSSTREVTYRNRPEVSLSSAVVYGGLLYDLDGEEMMRESLAYNVPESGTQVSSVLPKNRSIGEEWKWGYLEWTEEESANIRQLLEENRIPVILYNGAKGNKESFKNLSAKKMPVIHLATHGFFLQDIKDNREERERLERLGGKKAFENPLLRSGLILAGGNNAWTGKPVEGVENGILFADDVAKMNLVGTELVVMSACETGLGTVDNSEGVFGLQRAFKLAGAQTLIMSLWEVNDEATSVMMNEFYRNWLSGKSKKEAFKAAQNKVRDEYESPFYWAAFVMMD